MKQHISICILIMYCLTTFGVGLQFHYCGKKISSVNVVMTDEHRCSCGTGKMKPECCKDEIKYFKIKSDHSKSSTNSSFNLSWSFLLPKIIKYKTYNLFSHDVCFSADKPPPDLNQEPLYKKNNIFLI